MRKREDPRRQRSGIPCSAGNQFVVTPGLYNFSNFISGTVDWGFRPVKKKEGEETKKIRITVKSAPAKWKPLTHAHAILTHPTTSKTCVFDTFFPIHNIHGQGLTGRITSQG